MSNNNIRNKILSEPVSYEELKSIKNLQISGIYKIENTVNHKVYIGQSKDVIKRLIEHLQHEDNPYLKKAFKKYSKHNFSFEIIKETYDRNYWETLLICIYHSTDKHHGYNILPGGEGGDAEVTKKQWEDPEIRKRMLVGTERYWNSPEGQLQKKINSERNKGKKKTKGLHWYNNGTENVMAEKCPDGYVPGRLGNFACSEEEKQKKREYERNLTPEQRKARSKKISEAHKGHITSQETRQNISKANKGRKYFNNGIIEVMRFEQPEGFVPGRLPSVFHKN